MAVFARTAFALPILLDQPVGLVEAMVTSWTVVEVNLAATVVWAPLLMALTAGGMATGDPWALQ